MSTELPTADMASADREVRRSLAAQARQHADEQARFAQRIRTREHYQRYWSPYAQRYADTLDDCAAKLRAFANSLITPDDLREMLRSDPRREPTEAGDV